MLTAPAPDPAPGADGATGILRRPTGPCTSPATRRGQSTLWSSDGGWTATLPRCENTWRRGSEVGGGLHAEADAEIDRIVYALYGLSREEIAVVEGTV